jgi:acetyl-CoA acetyltransferase
MPGLQPVPLADADLSAMPRPLNTHGGQLSAGRSHGFGILAEAISQLRGDAAERQVADARVAVVTTGGGTPGGALLLRRSN